MIEVLVTLEDDAAVLRVTDTGPGVAIEDRQAIFEKFARGGLADSVPGLGLGLFLTRSIVRAHDGVISVGERTGGGARFDVRLPLARFATSGAAG